jgi:hypothetical protein
MRAALSVPVPVLLRFAQLANSWLVRRSQQAEEALLGSLAPDVRAPSFGGHGRDSVRRGFERLAGRYGSSLRLVVAHVEGKPSLLAWVQRDDGRWHDVGHFSIALAEDGSVAYLDYRHPGGEDASEPPHTDTRPAVQPAAPAATADDGVLTATALEKRLRLGGHPASEY